MDISDLLITIPHFPQNNSPVFWSVTIFLFPQDGHLGPITNEFLSMITWFFRLMFLIILHTFLRLIV